MERKLLTIQNLVAGYRDKIVLSGLDVSGLVPGEITALVGPNAAGKSTLLRVLAGLLQPKSGKIWFGGTDLLKIPGRARARVVSYMPQSSPVDIRLPVIDTVVSSLKVSPGHMSGSYTGKNVVRLAENMLGRVGIAHLAMEYFDRLSGGQRQMASLARAMVRNPAVFLLDEPTSALDLRHQIRVMKLIREFADEGRIVVIVLHDINQTLRWADRVLIMHEGRIVGKGSPREAMTPEIIRDIYGVDVSIEISSSGYPVMIIRDELKDFNDQIR